MLNLNYIVQGSQLLKLHELLIWFEMTQVSNFNLFLRDRKLGLAEYLRSLRQWATDYPHLSFKYVSIKT